MIYIISVTKSENNEPVYYRIFDTCSDSTMLLGADTLRNIISNTNIQVMNANITKDIIILKEWPNGIPTISSIGQKYKRSGAKYILLASKYDNTFKIVDYDGNIYNILLDELESRIISNCSTNLEMIDTYKIYKDEEFEKAIETKYNSFVAKTLLLGKGQITFDYEIENQEVRLKKYTGKSKEVILPPFVTAIMKDAFSYSNIQTIKINEGLKVIGKRAFVSIQPYGRLERVEIAESVELIGAEAFIENTRLFRADGTLNENRFKLLSTKTVVMDQFS